MSEFRRDLVSGEWIIIAPERAKRPNELLPPKKPRVPTARETCPFEDLQATGNWPPYLAMPDEVDWEVVVIPNKYPALKHAETCPIVIKEGLYEHSDGAGYHDLLVFRNHDVALPDMPLGELANAFATLQERYRMVADDPCLVYTSAYFNWGQSVGASLYHPHFQIVTLPIIPPHILHSLVHSTSYFEKHGTCVHCAIISFEAEAKERVVAENDHAIAIMPYASRQPFEVKVFPKAHVARFDETEPEALRGVTEIIQQVLGRIRENLNDPDLNFFIHTSPNKNKELYSHYHWHLEILPKISIQAGLELGTGILINVVEPEAAARMLRGEAPDTA